MEDTVLRRGLPSEGALDLGGFVACMQAIGYHGWYGVEIISEEHAARTLADAAQASFNATMRQFA